MCNNVSVEGVEQVSPGRGGDDQPGDPLFPLMPKVIEALRGMAIERAAAQGEGARALPSDDYAMLIETICGVTDDSQPVEQYDGTLGVTQAFVANHQQAVGQIQWNDNLAGIYTNPGNVSGQRWCSGTLITDNLFLTAGHCFDQTGGGWRRPRVNGTSNIIPSSEIATNMHVNFNYQVDSLGNPRPVAVFGITELLEYRLGGLDFAIVRLAGNPGATWGKAQVATTDAVAGDMLCVMGHPEGVPKRIEAGPALAPIGNRIRYDDIDTLGGNSGSGVLRASDGRLVGVHTNGGCGAASPNGTDANFGQRILALIAASPTLTELTRPSIKHFDDGPRTTRLLDVGVGTIKRIDDGPFTVKVLDDGPGTTKFIDDGGGSIKRLDDGPGTIKVLDDGVGTLKRLDDVKSPALDKAFSDVKLPALDARPPLDPGRPPFQPGGFARPFALALPHHTMGWAGESVAAEATAQTAQVYEAALAQLSEGIAQQQQVLQALEAEFQQVLIAYQQDCGQDPSFGQGG